MLSTVRLCPTAKKSFKNEISKLKQLNGFFFMYILTEHTNDVNSSSYKIMSTQDRGCVQMSKFKAH